MVCAYREAEDTLVCSAEIKGVAMARDTSIIQDLTVGNLRKKLIVFAVPFMLTNLMQTLYNVVDMIIVGQLMGSAGLSAVSMGGLLTSIMLEFGIGLSTGGQIYISQLVGAKRKGDLNAAIWTVFWLVIGTAVVVAILGVALHRSFLTWINTPAEAIELAADYVRCCCFGMIFLFGYSAIGAVLRGMGNSAKPMQFAMIATAANILLDIAFVGFFKMSTFGAALATVIAQGIAFLCALAYLYRVRETIGLQFTGGLQLFSFSKALLIVKLGAPLTLMQVALKGSMLYVNSFINLFGVSASALVGVGDKLYSVVCIVTTALAAAVGATVGQNMGAGKPLRAQQAVGFAGVIGCAFVAILTVFVLLFPEGIFRIFTADAEVIAFAPKYLRISLIMYWCFALMSPTLGLITGVGNTALNSVIGILDSVVARIGLSLLLGITCGMGLWGYVLGSSLAGVVSVVIGGTYFLSGKWKTRSIL